MGKDRVTTKLNFYSISEGGGKIFLVAPSVYFPLFFFNLKKISIAVIFRPSLAGIPFKSNIKLSCIPIGQMKGKNDQKIKFFELVITFFFHQQLTWQYKKFYSLFYFLIFWRRVRMKLWKNSCRRKIKNEEDSCAVQKISERHFLKTRK